MWKPDGSFPGGGGVWGQPPAADTGEGAKRTRGRQGAGARHQGKAAAVKIHAKAKPTEGRDGESGTAIGRRGECVCGATGMQQTHLAAAGFGEIEGPK